MDGGTPADCDLYRDPPTNQCRGLGGPLRVGGELLAGDPIDIAARSSRHDVMDFSLGGTIAPFALTRSYVSSEKTWAFEKLLGSLGDPLVPKPFASSAAWRASLRWWHSLYSFVYPRGWSPGSSTWTLQEGDGSITNFVACSDGTSSCFATPSPNYSETRAKLYWQNTGGTNGYFIVFFPSGRHVFQDVWSAGSVRRFFLSRIEDAQYPLPGGTARVVAQLSYAVPNPSCPGQSSGSNPGVPYLSQVTTAEGAQINFQYQLLAGECVLSSVSLADRSDGGTIPLVQYAYGPDGGVQLAGFLTSSTWPARGAQSYQYAGDAGITILEAPAPGAAATAMTKHQPSSGYPNAIDTDLQLSSGTGLVAQLGLNAPVAASCTSGSFSPLCQTAATEDVTFPNMSRGDGQFTSGPPPAGRTYLMETTSVDIGRRTKGYVDTCSPSSPLCDATSPGTVSWTWIQLPGSNFVTQAAQDKRGNWTAYGYSLPSSVPADAGFLLPSELTALYKGATSPDGGGALETVNYSYIYGGTTQSPRAYEQLRSAESRPSVVQSGQNAVTQYIYDASVNRLKAVIKSGYTQTWNGSTWATAQRYIGTFYFTRHVCLNESSDDALGRTLEIHGPCLVAGPNSTDCDVAPTTNVPITQYFYWPANAANNNANRLQKVSRFPQNGGPSACSAFASLDTTYGNYDALGNPMLVTDSNGVAGSYTYEENRVKSQTTGGQTTSYTYELGKLTSIQYPAGNYEVFCYRRDCSSFGTWTNFLFEKRKTSALAGGGPDINNWTETVKYDYGSDNQLTFEQYFGWYSGGQEERQRHYYHRDGRGRMTWESEGINASWATHYETKRLFDGANNLTGIASPFNSTASAFCGGADSSGQPVSPLCSALSYDRANRLNGLDEVPSAGGATRTCLTYDAQGNVKSVVSGCPLTSSKGDCSTCTQPLASYQYDDFGNVISATLPWIDNGSGGSGTIRYDYDARGNIVNKQTPAMVANGDYLQRAYDGLGRELSLTHFFALPTPGNELLYSLGYDNSATLDPSCPQPDNALGRMLYRNDSFGQTWFQYDVWGRVTKEIRLRQGSSVCSATAPNLNPHTSYAYSVNGNLTSIVYPYGRTVTYNYGTFPNSTVPTDRVKSIDINTYNGTSWTTLSGVISNIAWEPYGGLRDYTINHGPNLHSAVEYFRGETYSTLSNGCPATSPWIQPFAYAGHQVLKGLWVSSWETSADYVPGWASGSILKMNYTYAGDQVTQIDSCLLDATTARIERFKDDSNNPGYDPLLRLILATRPSGNFAAAGGSFNSRAFGYDGRGNRTTETLDACAPNPNVLTYGAAGHPDQLTRRGSGCANATPPSILAHSYSYDLDGRVYAKSWENDSSGVAAYALSFAYGETDGTSGGALDTVFKGVSVNGAVYNYFYDALNRRRMKVYPLGNTDEYFYDMGHQLLLDQGNDSANAAPTFHPDDNYVWLGGRPIVVIRGKTDLNFGRLADSAGDCTRNWEPAACGFYFPVTDHIGKPILMLDAQRRVVGTGEYDPFGYVNRVQLHKDTVHPYPNNYNAAVADFVQARGAPSLTVSMRVLLHQLDVQDASTDSLTVYEGDPPGQALDGPYRGYHQGQLWTNWVTPSAGHLKVSFTSGPQRCCPNGLGGVDCTCSQAPNFPYTGVVIESYQYRRYLTGAQPFWTPLGLPGQYFDPETDFFENWNRYYDISAGRYLEAEPLLRVPAYPNMMVHAGTSVSTYAYALNNPLYFVDENGFFVTRKVDYLAKAYEAQIECNNGSAWGCIVAAFYWFGNAFNLLGPAAGANLMMGGVVDSYLGAAEGICRTGAFKADQSALIELAKGAQRTGITQDEADILLQWAKEYEMSPVRNDVGTSHWVGGDHIHIGPVNHIPVVKP